MADVGGAAGTAAAGPDGLAHDAADGPVSDDGVNVGQASVGLSPPDPTSVGGLADAPVADASVAGRSNAG
ncbi:MAG TPA: hypothetical protein VIM24_09175 [Candidatus Limnocylindrales bacterium]